MIHISLFSTLGNKVVNVRNPLPPLVHKFRWWYPVHWWLFYKFALVSNVSPGQQVCFNVPQCCVNFENEILPSSHDQDRGPWRVDFEVGVCILLHRILHSSTCRRGLLLETGKSALHLFLLTLILTLRLQEALMLFWFIHFTLLLLLMLGLHNYWVVRRWSKAPLAHKTLCDAQ